MGKRGINTTVINNLKSLENIDIGSFYYTTYAPSSHELGPKTYHHLGPKTLVQQPQKRYNKSMKKNWLRLKRFFRVPTLSQEWEPADGFAEMSVVDLNAQERDFIDGQTRCIVRSQQSPTTSLKAAQTWPAPRPSRRRQTRYAFKSGK